MPLFLQILGVVALVVLGLLAVLALYLALKWQRLKQACAGLASVTPSAISVVRDPEATWANEPPARVLVDELGTLGFICGHTHAIPEMPGVQLCDFFDRDGKVRGVLYRHPAAGLFIDLCVYFEDGLDLTVSNAPQGSELKTRPGTEKLFHPGATPAELFAVVTERMQRGLARTLTREGFAAEFAHDYHTDIAWRNAQGGVSEEEVRKIADNAGLKLDDAQMQEAMKETRLADIRRWNQECIKEFSATTTLTVGEWKQHEDSMLIVRDDFHAGAFVAFLDEEIGLGEAETRRFTDMLKSGAAARDILRALKDSENVTVTHLGEVARPIAAEIHGITRLAVKVG